MIVAELDGLILNSWCSNTQKATGNYLMFLSEKKAEAAVNSDIQKEMRIIIFITKTNQETAGC